MILYLIIDNIMEARVIKRTEFNSLGKFTQSKAVCVLASYAVAAFPFTRKPVIEYFKDYCDYYNISYDPSNDIQEVVDNDFRSRCGLPGMFGYKIIMDLHDNAQGQSFTKARESFSLRFEQNSQLEIDNIENELRSGEEVLLMLFINESNNESIASSMHSVTIGYDNYGFFIYDVNFGYVQPLIYKKLSDLGKLGNAFLIKRE